MTENRTRILVLTKDQNTRDLLSEALADNEEYDLIMPNEVGDIPSLVMQFRPGILALNYTEGVTDTISQTTAAYPPTAIMVFMPAEEADKANDVILAGARAFVLMPTTKEAVLNSVSRVAELQSRYASLIVSDESELQDDACYSFVVYSPRGGAGTTTLAINLAAGIKKAQKNKPVLLVDGKFMFGDVDLMMNIKTQNTIADLLPYANNLDELLIRNVLSKHNTGVDVLISPSSVTMAEEVEPESLYTLLLSLQKMYRYIIADGGNKLDDNIVTLMDSSFRVIVPFTPDLASVRDVRRFLDIANTLNYPEDKIMLVLNKEKEKGGVSAAEVESVIDRKIAACIPYDTPNVLRSLNKGVPLLTNNPKAPAGRAIQEMVEDLLEQIERDALHQSQFDTRSQQSMLSDSSRLG